MSVCERPWFGLDDPLHAPGVGTAGEPLKVVADDRAIWVKLTLRDVKAIASIVRSQIPVFEGKSSILDTGKQHLSTNICQ